MERRCLPLWLPHFFLAGAGVCWAGGGVGHPWTRLTLLCFWTPSPFPALASRSHTLCPPTPWASLAHLLDDPDHLAAPQLLQGRAQRADGRSLRLLKPCGGGREPPRQPPGCGLLTQLQRQELSLPGRPVATEGKDQGMTDPHLTETDPALVQGGQATSQLQRLPGFLPGSRVL